MWKARLTNDSYCNLQDPLFGESSSGLMVAVLLNSFGPLTCMWQISHWSTITLEQHSVIWLPKEHPCAYCVCGSIQDRLALRDDHRKRLTKHSTLSKRWGEPSKSEDHGIPTCTHQQRPIQFAVGSYFVSVCCSPSESVKSIRLTGDSPRIASWLPQ